MDTQQNFYIKVVRSIKELPEQDWNGVFPKALENYHFFKTLDESSFDQFSFFYIMVYDKDFPIGATSCFIMDFSIDIAVRGVLKRFLGLAKKIFPNMCTFRALMCGLPMGVGRIGIAADADRERVMDAISDALEKIAKDQKAPLMIFKDFAASYDNMLKPLLSRRFLRVESFPSTEMDIGFTSFDEYLKTLSRASRENLKRNFKKIDGKIKIEMEIKDALDAKEVPEVHELYLQTYNRQEMGLEKLPLDFFVNVAKNMPKEVKFFLWRIDDRMVAFAFCLISGDYFIDYYLGFDYSVARRYYLYFVRFRGLLEWCIEHGIKKYEMGMTNYEPKRRLGFNFIRYYFYIKHRNKMINRLSGLVSLFLKPANFDSVFEELENRSALLQKIKNR